MNSNKKSILIRFGVSFGVGLLLVFFAITMQGFFTDDLERNLTVLSNAFFVAGILMVCFCGLIFVSNEGAFLGVGFALGYAFKALIPFARKKHETYQEYCERKGGKKKNNDICILITGLFFIAVCLIISAF